MSSRSTRATASKRKAAALVDESSAAPSSPAAAPPASPAAAAAATPVKLEGARATVDANGSATKEGVARKNRRLSKKAKVEAAAAAAAKAANLTPAAAKKLRQKERQQEEKEEEERQLEAFLFGSEDALLKPIQIEEQDGSSSNNSRKQKVKQEDSDEEEEEAEDTKPSMLFQIDTQGAHAGADGQDDDEDEEGGVSKKGQSTSTKKEEGKAAPKPAWQDADDSASSGKLVDLSSAARLRKLKTHTEERFISGAEYSKRLRQVFEELNPGTAAWAKLPEDATDADITTLLLQTTGAGATAGSTRLPGGALRGEKLPPTTVDLLRLKDANLADTAQGVITSTKFHPGGQLLLTAGLDKMVRLFQIDGVENSKVQGVWLEDMPIHSAAWLPSPGSESGEIIATGRRQHFYSIDIRSNKVSRIPGLKGREEKSLESMIVSPDGTLIAILGNDGYILLLSGRTKQLVGTLKQNGSVRSASFSPDASLLFSVGSEGILYIWDVATRRCVYKHQDEGNINGTAVAIDQANKGYYAIGADSGVVNMYHTQQISDRLSSSSSSSSSRFSSLTLPPPTPLKSIMNLVTPIDDILFNHDAQLMLLASRRKKDALKLVHVESQTVMANWPTSSTPLHYVSAVDFSPNSGYMTIGNDRGRVLLYRLTHYPKA